MLTNIESPSVGDLISCTINQENNLKLPENRREQVKQKPKSEINLLKSKISIVINDPNESESTLNAIGALRKKSADIMNRPSNPELDMDFRATWLAYQINSSQLSQACNDYFNAYQQKTSLYNIKEDSKRTNLIIYNTETENKNVKILKTPGLLDEGTCITQLPNGKLFCFGNNNYQLSRITVLIDTNGEVEVLPSGIPCKQSSCIYFNNSVYCFGGYNNNDLDLFIRFDLDRNRWIHLPPMPIADFKCNSIMFDGNILISGYRNSNLMLYSTDIKSFSTIPYEFAKGKRKILANTDRLYLFECSGRRPMYESEIGNYMNWRPIGKTSAINCSAGQVYCSYNQGFVYIGIEGSDYYKFDLNEKKMICVESKRK